jgi:hypothetical protein
MTVTELRAKCPICDRASASGGLCEDCRKIDMSMPFICPGCGSHAMRVPGAPRALPGHTLDPARVAADCCDCGHEGTVASFWEGQ